MQGAPLRPAVRASLLRLMADNVRPEGDFVLGTVTDRADHRGIAIASSGDRLGDFSVGVTIFDLATGAETGVEEATCSGPVSDLATANARCHARQL